MSDEFTQYVEGGNEPRGVRFITVPSRESFSCRNIGCGLIGLAGLAAAGYFGALYLGFLDQNPKREWFQTKGIAPISTGIAGVNTSSLYDSSLEQSLTKSDYQEIGAFGHKLKVAKDYSFVMANDFTFKVPGDSVESRVANVRRIDRFLDQYRKNNLSGNLRGKLAWCYISEKEQEQALRLLSGQGASGDVNDYDISEDDLKKAHQYIKVDFTIE